MIKFKHSGDFSKTQKWLIKLTSFIGIGGLNKYGKAGVEALRNATPEDTGKTKDSWGYEIKTDKNSTKIIFTNSNVTSNGTPVAILLQYGHMAKGTWVQGTDYINPAIKPIFDQIVEDLNKEIRRL